MWGKNIKRKLENLLSLLYTYWTSFQLGWRPIKLFQSLEEKPTANHCPGGYAGAAGLVIFGNQLWLFLFSSPTAFSDLWLVQWEHSHQCFLTSSAYKHERTKTLKNSSQLSTPTSCWRVGIQTLLTQLKLILWRIRIKSWLIPLLHFPPTLPCISWPTRLWWGMAIPKWVEKWQLL